MIGWGSGLSSGLLQDYCLASDDVVWVLDPESRLEKGLLLLSRSLHPRHLYYSWSVHRAVTSYRMYFMELVKINYPI